MQGTVQKVRAPSILDREWISAVVIVFLIEAAALFIISAVPVPSGIRQTLINQYNSLQDITSAPMLLSALYIFSHNYIIATVEFIPVIGIALFAISTASTALVVGAVGTSTGIAGPAYIFGLFTLPHTWLELPAYAIGITESLFLLSAIARSLFQGKPINEVPRLVSAWLLVAVELAVAALFESAEIKLAGINPAYVFITWLPFIVLLVIVGYVWSQSASMRERAGTMLPKRPESRAALPKPSARTSRRRRAKTVSARGRGPRG